MILVGPQPVLSLVDVCAHTGFLSQKNMHWSFYDTIALVKTNNSLFLLHLMNNIILVCLLCLSCRKSVHHKIFCGTIRLVHKRLFQCAFVDVRQSAQLCGQMDYLEWPSNYVVCMASPSSSRLVCFCMKDDGTVSNLFCSSLSMGGLRGMDWLHAAVSMSPMSKLGAQWKEVLE
jgi:hypothetical protein